MAAVWYRKTMPPIELAERLALLLALAFFGLTFEEIYKRDEPTIPGGIRTFPLVGLAGAMLYLVEPQRTVAFVADLLALGAWLYAFIRLEQSREGGSGGALVIPVSNLLVYVLGPIVLLQPPWVAVGVTVSAVLVIGTRERMHGFVRLISQDEVLTAGKFLILVGIILPLVPDTRLIATAAVTPYHIWLAVVAISGLSYLTYLVQRYLPIKGGRSLAGAARRRLLVDGDDRRPRQAQREAATRRPELSAGIVAANAIMYPRLAAVVAFFNLPLAVALLPASAFLFIVGAAAAWREWRKIEPGAAEDLAVPAANPLQLTTTLIFGALFMAVSLVTGWVEAVFGQTGVFTLAVLVGASDIDPFVLNLAQGGVPNMPLSAVAAAVLIAGSANNLAKAGYAIGFGGPAAAEQPANALAVLAVLGFATAAVYIL
jgi:uncharacterized membrane protein (DUF4010 family)